MSLQDSYNPRINRPSPRRRPPSGDSRAFWMKFIQPRGLISLLVVLVSLFILLNAIFGQHGYLVLRKQQQTLKQAEEERGRAQTDQQNLKKELEYLRTPEGIERAAREQMKLAKPGEIVVTVPDSGTPAKTDPNSPTNPSKNR